MAFSVQSTNWKTYPTVGLSIRVLNLLYGWLNYDGNRNVVRFLSEMKTTNTGERILHKVKHAQSDHI